MNGKDKLSIIPFTFFFFLGLYVVIKFFLVVFWTLNFNPRLIMELTPFFLLKMNPVQLFILSAIVAGSDAYFHFQNHGRNIVYSFIPTALMIIGIGAAIYVYEWSNPFYYILFILMLGVTVVDHRYLLHVNGYLREGEEQPAEEIEEITEKERRLEKEIEKLKNELRKVKPEAEVGVKEKEIAPKEEEFLEEILESGEVEEVPEFPEGEMENIPELSEEPVKEMEEEEMEIVPPEEEKMEVEVPAKPEEPKKKEESVEDLEALIEDLLELREKKKEMKECPVCGALNPPDAKYCKECGSELEEEK